MPGPSELAMTLAALQEQISSCKSLPLQNRRELRSAINTFAKVCNRTPTDIIADPAVIRGLSQRAPWQVAGLKKSTWANVLSRLTKAMAIGGIKVYRQRRNYKPDASWQALLAPMSRRDRDELHRFAGWCSVLSIAPQAVTPETFECFLAYLEEQMIQRDPRERAHVARRAWNRTLADQPGSPFSFIPPPEPAASHALAWVAFPASLQAEIEAYRQKVSSKDLFDEGHKPIKPVTLRNYLNRLRVYLTCLVRSGIPVEHFGSLAHVVDPELVKRGLELRLGKKELGSRERLDLHSIMIALLSVAKFVAVDEAHLRTLHRYERKVRHRPQGLSQKNKDRLAPMLNANVKRRLIGLPRAIAHEMRKVSKPTIRQAQRMQMAVLLDVLLHVPLRIQSAADLDLDKNILPPAGGQPGSWWISIAAEDVKNEVAIEASLGEASSHLLDWYVKVFRPVLMKQAPATALFVNQNGQAKGARSLSKQFAQFIYREVGLTVHAHLMRHFAAHIYLAANPGCYETVRRMLGHKSLATTVNSYAGTETDISFARYDALLESILGEATRSGPSTKLVGAAAMEDVL